MHKSSGDQPALPAVRVRAVYIMADDVVSCHPGSRATASTDYGINSFLTEVTVEQEKDRDSASLANFFRKRCKSRSRLKDEPTPALSTVHGLHSSDEEEAEGDEAERNTPVN